MKVQMRTRLAWQFLATFGCLSGGLAVILAVTRPLTAKADRALMAARPGCDHPAGGEGG
jgi:hypothetical protein